MPTNVPLRIRLVDPPVGYAFALQKGKGNKAARLDHQIAQSDALVFDLEVEAKEHPSGRPNLLGPFSQGTREARFFYLCVGTFDPPVGEPTWSGRVKIPLTDIDWPMINAAQETARRLTASYQASAPNGKPVLASVTLDPSWR
jgi:hypothetical protein